MPQERGWRPQGSDAEEIWDFVARRVGDVLEFDQAPGPQVGPGGPDPAGIPSAQEPETPERSVPQAP
jgi:hypothetical protein